MCVGAGGGREGGPQQCRTLFTFKYKAINSEGVLRAEGKGCKGDQSLSSEAVTNHEGQRSPCHTQVALGSWGLQSAKQA